MGDDHSAMTYEPLNTLKSVADDVWIVDGPVIRFGMPWPKIPFPTRMTIIRIGKSDLFIHSPTRLTEDLKTEIGKLGQPRWIIAPNRIHYWWTPVWKAAFPEAEVYLAPRVKEQAGDRIDFPYSDLDRERGYPWDAQIATLPVTGNYMTEVVFLHRPSRTLLARRPDRELRAGQNSVLDALAGVARRMSRSQRRHAPRHAIDICKAKVAVPNGG